MFQLINITIHKHPIFGYADINFSESEVNQAYPTGNRTSVIIGRNGIGKSYFLRAIVEIFKTIEANTHSDENEKIPELKYRFGVKYYLNGHEYVITDDANKILVIDSAEELVEIADRDVTSLLLKVLERRGDKKKKRVRTQKWVLARIFLQKKGSV